MRHPNPALPQNKRKHPKAFALVSTVTVMSLLMLLCLSFVNLARLESKGKDHQAIAEANARLALNIAIAELQKYAGPDQRVTARADITDPDWDQTESSLQHPHYTYVWDVSGSELDLKQGSAGTATPATSATNVQFTGTTESHRPGMKPGHDFSKKPAVLVSGNEFYKLTDEEGKISSTSYPEGYITADSKLDDDSISIIPADSVLADRTAKSSDRKSVDVPLVKVNEHSSYGWWIGDESIKARTNLGNRHESDSVAARLMAQRSPINPLRDGLDNTKMDEAEANKVLSVLSNSIPTEGKLETGWSYSPDMTSSSTSLLTDVRSGGLKQDLTYILHNDDQASNMPGEFQNNAPLLDTIKTKPWGGVAGHGDSGNGGLSPFVSTLRNYAQRSSVDPDVAVSVGEKGITPVLSQAQVGIHTAYRPVGAGQFQVYYSVFPSVTLWNPHNAPIKLDKKITIALERRSGTLNWWLNLFRANYRIQRSDGSIGFTENNVFNNSGGARGGWNFKVTIEPDAQTVIQPGEAIVFSPRENTVSHTPVAKFTPPTDGQAWTGSATRTSFDIKVHPGWRPGKGHLFSLDGRVHDASSYSAGNSFPRISFGLGGLGDDNLLWSASVDKGGIFSYWSRLGSETAANSPFFDPPLTTDKNQDARGSFPGILVKHALRMGDNYLTSLPKYTHPDQKTQLFPYMSNYNPTAVYHAAIGDSYSGNPQSGHSKFYSSAATELSPTLMGSTYDYQNARSIYTVPTTDSMELNTYIGADYLGPSKRMVVNELPTHSLASYPNGDAGAITSLTQLNHSDLTKGTNTPTGAIRYLWMGTSNYPAYPIGNSVADYRLNVEHEDIDSKGLEYISSLARLDNQNWRVSSVHYDVSYLLNDRFYDRYFFSTIPQSKAYDPAHPLVNGRLKLSTEDQEEYKQPEVAEHLTMQGGFNINSTSVAAWEMLLSSALGVDYPNANSSEAHFSNLVISDGSFDVKSQSSEDAVAGTAAVSLNQEEIRELAEAIVKQVKRRGPFPSLSAFVNRTNYLEDLYREDPNGNLGSTHKDVRYAGAIQAAIDSLKLNQATSSEKPLSPSEFVADKRFYPAVECMRDSANSHLPGTLKQSDILRQIDPVITARGDTFIIRTVGVSKDDTGKVRAKAACEVIVQRKVAYCDQSQEPDTEPYQANRSSGDSVSFISQLSAVNQRYGRRFEVQSFRWLPKNEVAEMTLKGKTP
ncbi:hypothetical protein SAMN02745181_0033 [Rubritalea squalenifaciens DSM 18772]|uniref:Uncharacterized protein n=1 Tax=Rubritalea squalenifaciens DSM 18772 TaxID=1123071 RepID=A0A1M6AT79_9BACT|nr:hypothetical protein [Rubritalea squalenifaciens]SHI39686.1 hypothetical protein SAMN02745181_0033 [Rubritalea squalenifaciens DSM 18772]